MILLVHLACPVVAWLLGVIFYPGNFDVRVGFLISSCVPMASSCLVWTTMTGGSVSLTILTLSIEAFIAPAIIPCVYGWCWAIHRAQLRQHDFPAAFYGYDPSLIGMWIRDFAGAEKVDKVTDYLNLLSKCADRGTHLYKQFLHLFGFCD
jgi:predicted Na+-dependent transporter